MNVRYLKILLLAGMLLLNLVAHAQGLADQDATPAIHIEMTPAQMQLHAGKPATLSIRITTPPGHHAYLDTGKDGSMLPIRISFTALEQAGIAVRRISAPRGEWDKRYQATVLRGDSEFKYALTAWSKAKASAKNYSVTVDSQICNDATGTCFFPRTDTLHLRLGVIKTSGMQVKGANTPRETPAPGDQAQTQPAATTPKSSGTSVASPSVALLRYTPRTERPAHSVPVWMLLAFVAGVLLNVMPCVLPVMSIKVLSLVRHSGESRRRGFGMGLVFAAGMLTVFLALAAAAILFGLGWGEQFQSQAFLVVMIAVVFAFALSLFGVYEFGVPQAVGTLAAHTTREGYGSAFLMGVLATLLATPCSGPFLGSTLAWTLTQPPVTVLLIFVMLGLGMALPYVILTAHPAFLKRLPKPGPWMETFKQVMGFLLVATVVYLMMSLNRQHLLPTIAFLFFVAVGGWIWGRYSVRPVTLAGRITVLAVALLVVAAGAGLSFRTLHGVLSPSEAAPGASLAWEPFDQARLLQYNREGRSVLLDFTADWCANCKFNEVRVYNSPAVRRLLQQKNVVAMKADLTSEGPETENIRRLMAQLGARSIPFLAVFPGDRPQTPYTLYDLVDTRTVSKLLKALPDPVEASNPDTTAR